MTIVLDSNCFIDMFRVDSPSHPPVAILFREFRAGRIVIKVSRHTLEELSRKPDEAYLLAQTLEVLPYWPIGSIKELVGTIADLSGSWADAACNEARQQKMKAFAKANMDIRDRGAYLDALEARADVFVTNDSDFWKAGESKLEQEFGLRVLSPQAAAAALTPRPANSK